MGKIPSTRQGWPFDWPRKCWFELFHCFQVSSSSISKVDILEWSMEEIYFVIICTVNINDQVIQIHASIDCEAPGIAVIAWNVVNRYRMPVQESKHHQKVEVTNRRPIESRYIMHLTNIQMSLKNHSEQLPMFITTIFYWLLVLACPLFIFTWWCCTIFCKYSYLWISILHDTFSSFAKDSLKGRWWSRRHSLYTTAGCIQNSDRSDSAIAGKWCYNKWNLRFLDS